MCACWRTCACILWHACKASRTYAYSGTCLYDHRACSCTALYGRTQKKHAMKLCMHSCKTPGSEAHHKQHGARVGHKTASHLCSRVCRLTIMVHADICVAQICPHCFYVVRAMLGRLYMRIEGALLCAQASCRELASHNHPSIHPSIHPFASFLTITSQAM